MTRLLRGERGSALVLTAMTIAALMGFAALAVDGGFLYYRHTRLQDLSDAAALAGAAQLAMSTGSEAAKQQQAFDAAVQCVRKNGYDVVTSTGFTAQVSRREEVGHMSVSFREGTSEVQVEISVDVPMYFARAISISSSTVGVNSSAQLRSDGLVPIAFWEGKYKANKKYSLTLSPGEGVHGNYGYLDFTPPSEFKQYLEFGYKGNISIGDMVETYPGVSHGQVKTAIAHRISACTSGCYVKTKSGGEVEVNVTHDCPRLILIPVVEGFQEVGGKSTVTVIGFVRFFVDNYNSGNKVLSGWCLGEAGPQGGPELTNGFAVREVKLIK